MTEGEWKTCTDPDQMLKFLRGKASDRKKRLFAVACCRYIWQWITHKSCRKAVEAAELYADGKIAHQELLQASDGTALTEWGENSLLADVSFACYGPSHKICNILALTRS
jgi:hypothetical protein